MTTEPTLPVSEPPGDDPKQAVLQKVDFVCRRIVQGQNATKCWEIKYYRVHTTITVVLSVLGSAGLIKKQYDLTRAGPMGLMTTWDWLIFLAALFALSAAVVLELYRAFGIDKKAMQAISAEDSFSRLLKALENALAGNDPSPDLERVFVDAKTLGTNFHDVLREPNPEDVERLKNKLINQFQKNWVFPATKAKGRTR